MFRQCQLSLQTDRPPFLDCSLYTWHEFFSFSQDPPYNVGSYDIECSVDKFVVRYQLVYPIETGSKDYVRYFHCLRDSHDFTE